MSCPFGHVSEIPLISIKPSQRTDPQIGSKIILYDLNFIWTDEHWPPSKLNQLRSIGDPVIDRFFDTYGHQLQHNDDIYQFLDELNRKNSEHICDDSCRNVCFFTFTKTIRQRPAWFDRDQIIVGQEFFLKYYPLPVFSIFFYTLTLGYGFQQLNNVLIRTQYLSAVDLHETYRRLIETFQMIVYAICGNVDNFDETFLDVIRVRILHGMVRHKLRKLHRAYQSIPVNQEDSLVTLLGFSFAVLQCLEERMGISISTKDRQGYLHLWRYIGWLIGIRDEYLGPFSTYDSTRTISESIFYHFYAPSSMTKHLVHHSLMGFYLHTILPFSFQSFNGFSQKLIGKEMSAALGIDRPELDLVHRGFIEFIFRAFRIYGWIVGLNLPMIHRRLIVYRRRRLKYDVRKALKNRLRNFALFRNETSVHQTNVNCPCGYIEKQDQGIVKTNDLFIFRFKQSSFNFVAIFLLFLTFIVINLFI